MVILPQEIYGATRAQLIDVGFKFGTDVGDLFVECELPHGWVRRSTSHARIFDILDGQGRKRAIAFCKKKMKEGRLTSLDMLCRYRIVHYSESANHTMEKVAVTDCGRHIQEFGEAKWNDLNGIAELKESAEAWLDENHPDWQNPLACW